MADERGASSGRAHVMVVDDEAGLRQVLGNEIEDFGYEVSLADSGEAALEIGRRRSLDLCLVDLKMPGMSGIETLEKLRALQPMTEVIILTGHGDVDSATAALKKGAYDFLTKPCPLERLEVLLEKALEKKRLAERALGLTHSTQGLGPIYLGESKAMVACFEVLKKAAVTEVPILLTGESGTGKELFAREAHRLSPFSGGPFVAINCGALQPALVESTLFGHESGSFTGANRRKLGLVEVAGDGTLFLDEVGELPLDIQVKLLRFTQFGEFQRVGGNETLRVTARLVAATNVDLEVAITKGLFRRDLYYRLNTIQITIPPLRERREDIGPLARCLMANLNERGRPPRDFSDEAIAELVAYPWPGNVRELKSIVDRLSILCESRLIKAADIRRFLPGPRALPEIDDDGVLPLKEVERRMILRALDRFEGDKTRAAEALEVSVKTLYNKLKLYRGG